jgi:LPS export ABC transporter protein LptC/lipopolysaccharide transport protein LptA
MQRTIKILRLALPIAFVAFVLVIVFSWNRTRGARDRSGAEPVVVTRRGDKPQVESKVFEDTQTIGGRVVSRIRAARVVAYSSNWNTLEDVHLTIFRPNGLTYELVCPQAQFNSQTKEADANGGVRVTSSDGVEIQTAQIHFDGNRLTNHIPVQFRIDRWNGNAGALDLDVEAEVLRLFERVDATMMPAQTADVPMTIKAADGTFRRRENDVTFTQNVVMTRAADRVTGDRIFGRLTQDRKTLVGLEGQGHIFISMSSAAGPGEDLGGKKDITCDRFYSELAGDGQISAIDAVGDTAPAHAVLDGPPRRDIVAKTFRIALASRVVSEMKAEWQVVMKELGPIPRQILADHVTIGFDGRTHKATAAFLEGNVKYTDPRNQAVAIRANYDIAGDQVVLTAQPGFDPTVTTDGNVLKAKQIEFSPRAGTARATGSVIAQLVSKQGAADSTNIFPSGKPVFVNSDLLTMRQANKVAVFTGNVRAWQDNNTLFAHDLQVQGAGDSMTARGSVRTILYNTGDAQRKTPMQSRSDQLLARKNDRRVDLLGNVQIDDEQRTMTSDHAVFLFDAARKLDRVEADKNVVLMERATQRKGTGDRAVYQVAQRMVYVMGKPATLTAPTGNLAGQQITFDLKRNKVEVMGPTSPTQGTYKTQP